MKKLVFVLLGASLLFNLALATLYFAGSTPAPASRPVAAADPRFTEPARPTIDANLWPSLQADALPELVRNLRDAGFPPELVRAIAAARLEEAYGARMKALFPGADQLPFWKNQPTDPKVYTASVNLQRERQLALREALGKDSEPGDSVSDALRGRSLDGLPPDKAEDIRRLFRDYDDKRSEIFASGVVYNMDRDKIAALEKAQHDAIARVLTPQELEDFDLRNSNTARQLRYDLGAFNPTEAEFRTLFRLRQPFDEQFSNSYSGGMPSQEAMRQRSDAQRLLNEQIKAALGPERGAEYQRTTDYAYRQTSLIVARLELPPETTNSVFAVQQDLQQRARDTMMNRSLAPDARTQQLAELQQEATAKLTPLLGGASGFEAYKQYGGSWMQMFQPRPPPTPRP
jgi:hypothetical protein